MSQTKFDKPSHNVKTNYNSLQTTNARVLDTLVVAPYLCADEVCHPPPKGRRDFWGQGKHHHPNVSAGKSPTPQDARRACSRFAHCICVKADLPTRRQTGDHTPPAMQQEQTQVARLLCSDVDGWGGGTARLGKSRTRHGSAREAWLGTEWYPARCMRRHGRLQARNKHGSAWSGIRLAAAHGDTAQMARLGAEPGSARYATSMPRKAMLHQSNCRLLTTRCLQRRTWPYEQQ